MFAAAGGTLIALCWLPTGLAPAAPLAFLLMMRALGRATSGREAVRLGLLIGAFRYGVAAHFLLALVRYSPLGIVYYLLAIAFILPWGVLEAWGALALERKLFLPRSIGFGLLWVAGEKARSVGDLSFPADLIAHGFGTAPAFLGWAHWIGPYGVTLAQFAVAALLDRTIEAWPRRELATRWAAAALALWIAPVLTSWLSPPAGGHTVAPLRVAIVQPNTPPEERAHPERSAAIIEQLASMTLDASKGADLVVWPEAARPGIVALRDGRVDDPLVAAVARKARVPILYGAVLAELDGSYVAALYNGAALAMPDGTIDQWYGKQHLLPFVEGVPFASLFGWSPRERAAHGSQSGVLRMIGNFSPGPPAAPFRVGNARIGVLICYEGMYPQLARAYEIQGANLLAVLTNDSWWGRSAFAPWHARMIAVRGRESELPVVRVADGGVSSATDAAGRLLARTEMFESRVLTVAVSPVDREPTFYARFGDVVLWLLPLAPAFALALRKRRLVMPDGEPPPLVEKA